MNTCKWCGRENCEEATRCSECGTEFIDSAEARRKYEASLPPPPKIPITLRAKVQLLVLAWVAAAVAMTLGAPDCWRAFWLFPVYTPFALFILPALGTVNDDANSYLLSGAGWLYYVILTVWGLRSQWRRGYFVIYTILCVSLVLNVAGCQAILHANWKQ